VRPPLIIGRRGDGRAARFAGMYTVLRGIASSVVPVIVALPDAYFDVVPVDLVAEAILTAAAQPSSSAVRTVCAGDRARPVAHCVALITEALNQWRTERALEPFAMPRLVSPASWQRFYLPLAETHLSARQAQILSLLSNFQPYLALTTPLRATETIECDDACLTAAVRYWADCHSRLASQPPKPWQVTPASAR
jgi:Male sterility protein